MSDWTNLPPGDLAQITISIVVPRRMFTEAPQRELLDAVHGILGDDIHHTLLMIGNVRDEVYSSTQHRKSFDEYMTKAHNLLQPLVDHIGVVDHIGDAEVTQTGGGCLAVTMSATSGDRFGRGNDAYILVTDSDGPMELPTEEHTLRDRKYAIGVYNNEGEGWVTFCEVSWDELHDAISFAHLVAEMSPLDGEESFDTFGEAREKYA